MQKTKVFHLSTNMLGQERCREIERNPHWSVSYITLAPEQSSHPKQRTKSDLVYILVGGVGTMVFASHRGKISVGAGNVISIPRMSPHQIFNEGILSLQYLAVEFPPREENQPEEIGSFDRQFGSSLDSVASPTQLPPRITDCFDGSRIVYYDFEFFNLDVTFARYVLVPNQKYYPHYHRETTEWVYVVEGGGAVQVDQGDTPFFQGDWFRIDPGEKHMFRSNDFQEPVLVRISTPKLNSQDVHY